MASASSDIVVSVPCDTVVQAVFVCALVLIASMKAAVEPTEAHTGMV